MNRLLPLALSVVIGLCGYILPAPTAAEVQVTELSKQAAASVNTNEETVTYTETIEETTTQAEVVTASEETTQAETTATETETAVETTKAPETTKAAETTKAPETTKKSKSKSKMMWPAEKNAIITAGYPYYSSGAVHNGVDIALYNGDGSNISKNTNIYAAEDGVVVTAYNDGNWNTGFGNYCIIDHGNGVQTLYAHSSDIRVSEGDTVKQGQVIGLVGDTGNTTAPHLHFEVRVESGGSYHRTNPLKFISEP